MLEEKALRPPVAIAGTDTRRRYLPAVNTGGERERGRAMTITGVGERWGRGWSGTEGDKNKTGAYMGEQVSKHEGG